MLFLLTQYINENFYNTRKINTQLFDYQHEKRVIIFFGEGIAPLFELFSKSSILFDALEKASGKSPVLLL